MSGISQSQPDDVIPEDYYSIDSILAEEQKISCVLKKSMFGLGKLFTIQYRNIYLNMYFNTVNLQFTLHIALYYLELPLGGKEKCTVYIELRGKPSVYSSRIME